MCPHRESLVIEIGPGRGALTRPLLTRAERVVAIEVDPELTAALQRKYSDNPALSVIHADILSVDLTQWPAPVIAGNLPYYITSPIIEKVLSAGPPLKRAVFLIQKEVAERLVARPGTRDYGYLSVFTQFLSEPRRLFTVPPGAFHPPPKVDSAVVELRMKPSAERPPRDEQQAFLRFAGACFAHKRKTLRNNLAGIYGRETIDGLPEAALRAEQLSLPQLKALFDKLSPSKRYT